MTTKKRSVLLSVMTLVLCLALVAGGTYALFSDQVSLENHLVAGKLDITLERTKLETTALDATTGYLKTSTVIDDPPKDFSSPTTENENVFGITPGTRIVPRCSYAATMRITNNGDVAFGYWLEIKLNLDGLTAEEIAALKLDEQIDVTVTVGTTTHELENNGLTIGSATQPIGKLAKAGEHNLPSSETFVVCVEFRNLENAENNLAQGQALDFDLIVHAVQLTETLPNS